MSVSDLLFRGEALTSTLISVIKAKAARREAIIQELTTLEAELEDCRNLLRGRPVEDRGPKPSTWESRYFRRGLEKKTDLAVKG